MNNSDPRMLEFDIRGQICPSTLLTALSEINKHKQQLKGREVVLSFRTNNRDCLITIPDAAKNMGYAVVVSKCEDHYVIAIEGARSN